MHRCLICRFDFTLDDCRLVFKDGRCVCVRCFEREVQDERPMPDQLRKEVARTINEVQL